MRYHQPKDPISAPTEPIPNPFKPHDRMLDEGCTVTMPKAAYEELRSEAIELYTLRFEAGAHFPKEWEISSAGWLIAFGDAERRSAERLVYFGVFEQHPKLRDHYRPIPDAPAASAEGGGA